MALFSPSIDYTDRDFDALRARLVALVKSVFPDWTDFEVAGFGNVLLEMYAFVGDVLLFYQDNGATRASTRAGTPFHPPVARSTVKAARTSRTNGARTRATPGAGRA